MSRSAHGRSWLASLVGMALLATGLGPGVASAVPGAASPGQVEPDQVPPAVLEQLEDLGRADFWVRFDARADLATLGGIPDWDRRGEAVYDALTEVAEQSQAQARARLDAEDVTYTSFHITNAIRVRGGDREVLSALTAMPGVEGVYEPTAYPVPEPPPEQVPPTAVGPQAVEWGIADIHADDVWDQLGVRGEDVVVANIDTGVQYDHPALVEQYRGHNGDGTFTHDYNWFDASGRYAQEPGDWDGHGTHTMGTMVGDDGGDNRVGVAPGARWIAATSDFSDAGMVAAGQWMLAPTDLTGANPDPGSRPHVVNNSWGSGFPSNDPFMEDVIEAWAAAGIFPVFSNGNSGPDCATSGSPGSRTLSYSVGSYEPDGAVSDFSSRGPGQDGQTKPDIAAPGGEVRSSFPGNDYATASGTSMAAPHVAGAVALAWSASPALVGDVESTRALLDDTARDQADDQCGGTEDDNNVYGEGRLDALALVRAAPIGDVGYVEGTVTDAGTGEPLAAARVELDGPVDRVLSTGPDGSYRARVLAGDYAVTASKFGWLDRSAGASVPTDATVVVDLELQPAPTGTVSGTVTDGSGRGFPLYARVEVSGTTLFTYTDPADGSYSLDVPLDTYVLVTVDAQYPGYQQGSREMQLSGDTVADFALPVDSFSCVANGYSLRLDGATQTFDGDTAPPGWTVEDDLGGGAVWRFDDPDQTGNLTGGDGGFAVASNLAAGGEQMATSLVSPSYDLSGTTTPTLQFAHHFAAFGETADVDVSVDGGATWENLARFQVPREGVREILPLPVAGDLSDVRVRFRYHDAVEALWWQVDDVFVGDRSCVPAGTGGYVVGNVLSTTTGEPVRGAKVTSLDAPRDAGVTRDTPADANLDDGFYWLYSTLVGEHPFEATARHRRAQVRDVDVPADGAVRADFTLAGGLLQVDPAAIDTQVVLGDDGTERLTVTNTGDGTAEVQLQEVRGAFELLRADGRRLGARELSGMPGAPERRVAAPASTSAFPAAGAPVTGATAGTRPAAQGPAEEPWTELTPHPSRVMDNRVVNVAGDWYSIGGSDGFEAYDAVHRLDHATMRWTPVASLPEPVMAVAAGVVGERIVVSGGWRPDGTTSAATYVYDVAADTWSRAADAPWAVSAAGQAVAGGLLYTVGGCSTGDCAPMSSGVSAYDPETDQWTELAEYPVPAAFPSCGGIGGQVYCTGGVEEATAHSATYAYDPATDSWSEVAAAPTDWWGSSYAVANGVLVVTGGIQGEDISNESYAYDPVADAWVDLPNPNTALYRGAGVCGFGRVGGAVGFDATDVVEHLPGYDDCGGDHVDVTWLSLSQTQATLAPGESLAVEVTTAGAVPQPGRYTAGVRVVGGIPGSDPTVPVTMAVSPPVSWGKVQGTVSGRSCDAEDLGPLAGAALTLVPTGPGQPRWYLVTDAEGRYARWIDTRVGELTMTAFLDGWYPESVTRTVPRGRTTVQDFALLDAGCEAPPGPLHPLVERMAGDDRYETAAQVSQRYSPGVDTVFVATGTRYPDVLTAAARAGSLDSPVLLTRPDRLVRATREELVRLGPDRVVVVGGPASVGEPVLRAIRDAVGGRATVERWAGDDRYETAAVVAESFEEADVVYVATGEDFPDALAASARAGALDAPVLLVRHDRVPAAIREQLQRLGPERILVLGRETVSQQVLDTLARYGPVERVPGADRYGTAAALARDLATSEQVFVASGLDWPDAVAAAALAAREDAPVLLVLPDRVPEVTWAELDRLDPGQVWVVGGHLSVGDPVLDRLRSLE